MGNISAGPIQGSASQEKGLLLRAERLLGPGSGRLHKLATVRSRCGFAPLLWAMQIRFPRGWASNSKVATRGRSKELCF
jgi:hypothetical protein